MPKTYVQMTYIDRRGQPAIDRKEIQGNTYPTLLSEMNQKAAELVESGDTSEVTISHVKVLKKYKAETVRRVKSVPV